MKYVIVAVLFLVLNLPQAEAGSSRHLTRAQEKFVTNLVKKDHFDRGKITQYLLNNQPSQSVIKKIQHPAESRSWQHYKHIFMHPSFINGGYQFYNKNKKTLDQAYKRYGVDRAIIVALIGVETRYGAITGNYSAIRALNTLAFYHTHHAYFFQCELRALFVLARNLGLNPETIQSSYAGALGMAQFMPSTYLAYGVSHSKHHTPDLFHTPEDAIFSIANYLKKLGWKKEAGVAKQSQHHNPRDRTMITLGEGESREYWRELPNLKFIKCYNHSTQYAIVVTLLANKIRENHG